MDAKVAAKRSEFERRYLPCPLSDNEIELIINMVDDPWVLDCMFEVSYGEV